MPVDERFRRQVALLVRTLPVVAEETCFALKGGTASNLFVRDLPRLSVDIDLTYCPGDRRDDPPCARLGGTLRGAGDGLVPYGVDGAEGQAAGGSGRPDCSDAQPLVPLPVLRVPAAAGKAQKPVEEAPSEPHRHLAAALPDRPLDRAERRQRRGPRAASGQPRPRTG